MTTKKKENAMVSDRHYCTLKELPARTFPRTIAPARARAIIVTEDKWVNGTVLHYYFFDNEDDGEFITTDEGEREWVSWVGSENQRSVVRRAFKKWKEIGVGLEFEEVDSRDEAEVRIGFMDGDGAWSYLGTYVLRIGPKERTMNFGWKLASKDGADTALHEIGHTLGLPHEHQNPYAGIVWDEEAVYEALAMPPNEWSRETTHYNIIRKIDPDEVQGSAWDPNSIMHYPFERGMIKQPVKYSKGLNPASGLSQRDVAWIQRFYPVQDEDEFEELIPGISRSLEIANGDQKDFTVRPDATRYYTFSTFGYCDSIIALFRNDDGDLRYRTADDDGGEDRNAKLRVKLTRGKEYVLRVRLKYSDLSAPPTIMMW